MLPIAFRTLLGAAAFVVASQASATAIFSSDFSTGIGPYEALIGNFTVKDGYVGHHGSYGNNEYSSCRIVLDLEGLADAFLNFDVSVQTERNYDALRVLGNDVVSASIPAAVTDVPEPGSRLLMTARLGILGLVRWARPRAAGWA